MNPFTNSLPLRPQRNNNTINTNQSTPKHDLLTLPNQVS
jgi:hypothetical protein